MAAWGEVEEVPFRCTGPCTTSTSLPLTVALAELATTPLAALGELAVAVAAVKAGAGLDAVGLTSIPSAFPVEITDVVVFTAAGFLDLTSALHSFRNRSSSSSPTGPSSCSRSRCSSSSLDVCSGDATDMLASVGPEMPLCEICTDRPVVEAELVIAVDAIACARSRLPDDGAGRRRWAISPRPTFLSPSTSYSSSKASVDVVVVHLPMSLHPPRFPSPAPTPEHTTTVPPAHPTHSLPPPGNGPIIHGSSLSQPAGVAPAPSHRVGEASPVRQPIITAQDVRDQKTREEIEKRLLRLTQDLYELEICAGAVMKDQEDRIPQFLCVPSLRHRRAIDHRFNINEHYAALNDLARQLRPRAPEQPGGGADGVYEPQNGSTGDRVPRKVIEDVDGYRNPHAFTKTTLQRATGENQYALGRILGLEVRRVVVLADSSLRRTDEQSFRRQLESGLKEQMPHVPLPARTHRPVHPVKAELAVAREGAHGVQNSASTNLIGEGAPFSGTGMNGHASQGQQVKTEQREGAYDGMVNGAL